MFKASHKPLILVLFLGLFLSATPKAYSKLYLEPSVGGFMGSTKVSSVLVNYSHNTLGPSGGVKFGVNYDYVYILLDVKASYLILAEAEVSGTKITVDPFLYTSGGLSLGFDWNIPIRLTLGADILHEASGDVEFPGSPLGIRVALSYYLGTSSLLNLEYQSVGFKDDATGAKVNLGYIGLSLSVPFEINYPTKSWKKREI